ncbi:copper resistance protein B [Lysobacter sp. OAE881]|uniref:copper resistance protein B n=1 Tax=Lysobacter sp. OAE881 TaxID=2663813 RepID=UPI00178BFD0A
MTGVRSLLACALSLALAPAWAQDHSHHHAPPSSEPKATSTHDHASMDHAAHQQGAVDHAAMGHGTPTRDAPVEPIPTLTDADRAAAFPDLAHGMHHAPERNSFVIFDRLEAVDLDHGRGEAWEAQAWIGSDLNRLLLRSEGERERGHTEAADLEVLYGRSVTPWWDVVAGLKHDFKPGRSRDWAAFGVQGLAPYKFEVSATAYLGESGATAATVEAEYEVLLTNRLILQPRVEVEAFGKDDPTRGIGSGLSTVEAGLRLRYEFTRRFAPYIGVAWERAYGGTADHRRDDGEAVEDTHLVAGVRLWF